MRISCLEGDSGYLAFMKMCARGARPRIFLDGVERTKVTIADEEQRMIVRRKTDAEGRLKITNAGVEDETLYGDVRIEEHRSST